MPRSSTVDHISEVPNDLDRQVYILKIVMVKGGIFLEILSDIFIFIFWNVVLCVYKLKKYVEFAPGNPRLLGMGSQWPSETVGPSLYLTAVTSHFLSACFTCKTLTCNELCVH